MLDDYDYSCMLYLVKIFVEMCVEVNGAVQCFSPSSYSVFISECIFLWSPFNVVLVIQRVFLLDEFIAIIRRICKNRETKYSALRLPY